MLIIINTLWKPIIEIAILWFVFYKAVLYLQGTRAVQVLRGVVILLFAFFLFQFLGFETLDWLLSRLFAISIIGALIVFQPEIRQGLARLGRQNIFKAPLGEEQVHEMALEIVKAAEMLSEDKTGALIAIEKEDRLKAYVGSGVAIDGKITSEIIQTVFSHGSLLHDGGIIIRRDRIAAAGCLFPLTDKSDLSRVLGTRHRAAIGLTEETDAVVVVVSEQSGAVSLCYKGSIASGLDPGGLLKKLKSNICPDSARKRNAKYGS